MSALSPALVTAQDVTLSAPPHCGTLPALEARVAQLAGKEAAARATARIAIEGPVEGKYQLEATVLGVARRSTHADCLVLFDAAALIIAFSVNPQLAAAPAASAPEAPEPAPTAAPLPAAERASKSVWAHAEAGVLYGVLPTLDVPLSLGIRTAVERVGATWALRYAPPVASGAGPRVRAQLFGSTLVGHYTPWAFLQLGAGLEADLLQGRGRGVPNARSDVTSRVAVRFELLLRYPLGGRHQLALASALGLAVHRPPFTVIDDGPVFQPSFLTFSGGLRWEVTIL